MYNGEIEQKKTKFVWSLENFQTLIENNKYGASLASPIFNFGVRPVSKWQIIFFPSDLEENENADKTTKVCLLSRNKFKISVHYSFEVENHLNSKKKFHTVYEFNNEPSFDNKDYYIFNIHDFPAKSFKLVLEISDHRVIDNFPKKLYDWENKILCDFRKLFSDKTYADFIIKVKDNEYKIHKAVFAARSCEFRKIFEKNSHLYSIDYIETASFQKFVKFIYCNELEDLNIDGLKKLLDISNLFAVYDLKNECIKQIIDKLNVDNVIENFIYSVEQKNESLKKSCVKFMIKNMKYLIVRPEFDHLKRNSELIIEIFNEFCELNS